MFTTLTLQLPTDTLLKLIAKLRLRGGSQDLSETITQAIEDLLAAPARFEPGADTSGIQGYQWKTLFLPEGTKIKSWSYGENNYAVVEGDKIIHNGRSVSPNQFAQSFANSPRNAWTDLSVRRPGDKHFQLACRLRQELAEEKKRAVLAASQTSSIKTAQTAQVTPSPPTAIPIPIPTPSKEAEAKADAAPTRPRNTDREPGWNLPERRQFRYRLEDVAY